ncbi:MAG: hypothetical protein EKK61_02200 [Rickettsiales bacterium]|nr:MAG: hypothetical protein EKK61_02200 [Rickettsiales bacterium]
MNIRQKFLFENFLEFSTKELVILRHSDGKDWIKNLPPDQKEILNNTHLYFICKKPRFNFIPDTLFFDKNTLQIGFELSSKDNTRKQIDILHNYSYYFNGAIGFELHKTDKSKITVYYHHNSSRTIPIEHIFPLFDCMPYNDFSQFSDHNIIDYEILYIGQSVGRKRKSNAVTRTSKGHHKLPTIVKYTSEYEPHYEIFIILATIQAPYNIAFSGGQFFDSKYTKNNSLQELKHLGKSHSMKKIVDLMEACLIKYFDTKYNKKLKGKPILGTELFIKEYKENYDLNTALTVIDTRKLPYVNLCSPIRKSNNVHKIYNTIHKENDRLTIGDIIKI